MTETKASDRPPPAGAPEQREERPKRQTELLIDLQLGDLDPDQRAGVPPLSDLQRWTLAALDPNLSRRHADLRWPVELTVRVTDEHESAELNQRYRSRSGPTNVLSFAFEPPPGLDLAAPAFAEIGALLGDLVICAPLVKREAAEQGKTETAHWAHLMVHGTLHLLGFDHITAAEAAPMEALEIRILGALGFPPPYEVNDDANGERRRI